MKENIEMNVKKGRKRLAELADGSVVQLNLTVKPELRHNLRLAAMVRGKKLQEICEDALAEFTEKVRGESENICLWKV